MKIAIFYPKIKAHGLKGIRQLSCSCPASQPARLMGEKGLTLIMPSAPGPKFLGVRRMGGDRGREPEGGRGCVFPTTGQWPRAGGVLARER